MPFIENEIYCRLDLRIAYICYMYAAEEEEPEKRTPSANESMENILSARHHPFPRLHVALCVFLSLSSFIENKKHLSVCVSIVIRATRKKKTFQLLKYSFVCISK